VNYATADLCDEFGEELQVPVSIFHRFGRSSRFFGEIETVEAPEDNSFVCVRDVEAIDAMEIGVLAPGTCPVKTEKLGRGTRGRAVEFAGVRFAPGAFLYADRDGVVVSDRELPAP
jgi:regulator of ribonuclease activity A